MCSDKLSCAVTSCLVQWQVVLSSDKLSCAVTSCLVQWQAVLYYCALSKNLVWTISLRQDYNIAELSIAYYFFLHTLLGCGMTMWSLTYDAHDEKVVLFKREEKHKWSFCKQRYDEKHVGMGTFIRGSAISAFLSLSLYIYLYIHIYKYIYIYYIYIYIYIYWIKSIWLQ